MDLGVVFRVGLELEVRVDERCASRRQTRRRSVESEDRRERGAEGGKGSCP